VPQGRSVTGTRSRPTLTFRISRWGWRQDLIRRLLAPSTLARFRYLPGMPRFLTTLLDLEPPIGARSLEIPPLPEELKGRPGILRNPAAEEAAFTTAPLPRWEQTHLTNVKFYLHRNWLSRLLMEPQRERTRRPIEGYDQQPAVAPAVIDPQQLSDLVTAKAKELGFSAVGFAPLDPKYEFAPSMAQAGDVIVVCVLEQNWAATQAIPSLRSEVAHTLTYNRMNPMMVALADYIRSLGYRAIPTEAAGRGVSIHYGVEAGLGQLGLNGQLLTPFAGSRCRLMLINTNAPLALGAPADYGIPQLCNACQVCVKRCPTGAITNQPKWHRGVYKAKIKMDRCLPMIGQVWGCAICMKVCPVQRYGLPAVIEHYTQTGDVLGKGTDELEGYSWPFDGKFYGAGEKPKDATSAEILRPPELARDAPVASGG
jgi:epoxyqueuosine reductase